MRLRNVPGSKEEMLVNPFVIQEPKNQKGKWNAVFQNEKPLYIEVGTGKGQFISALAVEHPERNYIGIEKYSSVLLRALQKRELMEVDNLFFLRLDAEELTDIFDEKEVSGIYLNFSDPWPKDRHAKRRLTSVQFLHRYEQIMADDAVLEFKTDNVSLFDFSLESIEEAGWELLYMTRDLHHSEYNEGNIMTEYEERFSSQGNLICKFAARPKKA